MFLRFRRPNTVDCHHCLAAPQEDFDPIGPDRHRRAKMLVAVALACFEKWNPRME
jgi:hypothetical protein